VYKSLLYLSEFMQEVAEDVVEFFINESLRNLND